MGGCCSTNGSVNADSVRPMSPADHDPGHSLEADLRAAGMQTIQLDGPAMPKKADPVAPSTASLFGASSQGTGVGAAGAAAEQQKNGSKRVPAGRRDNNPIPSVTLVNGNENGLSSVSNSKRSSPKLISAKPSSTNINSTTISAALVSLPNAAHTNSFIVAHTSKSSITALDASGTSQPIMTTSSTPKAAAAASTTTTNALSNANASAATAKMEEEQRKARKAAKKEKKEKKKKKELPVITVDSPPSLNGSGDKAKPTRLRRTLSLEEEEDERTARSLRNFEAERVLEAQEQALMVTFHQAQLGEGSGGLSSASPSSSPPTTARARSMLISPTSVVRFPTPSASVGTVHFVNLASPNSGTSTPPSSSHHHDAYANPDLLNEPAASALFTPTGQRTAMALLLSSNLTSANASAAPSGRNSPAHGPVNQHGHNGSIAMMEDFLSPKQAAQFHATSEHRKQFSFGARSLMLHAQSSRTVPSSPRESRDTSPVHSFARTPRGKLQAHLPPITTNLSVKMSTADNTPTGNGPTSLGANTTAGAAVAAASAAKVATRTHPRTLAPLTIPPHPVSQSANNSPRPHHHTSHSSSNAIHPVAVGLAAPLTSTAAAGHCPLITDSIPRRPASAQGTGNGLPSAWRPQNYTKQTAYQRFQARLKAASTAPQGISSKQMDSAWNQP